MKRFMVLVTVVLLMIAVLLVTAAPTFAVAGPPALLQNAGVGVAVDPAACEIFADGSSMFAWRPGGVCWFTPPAL